MLDSPVFISDLQRAAVSDTVLAGHFLLSVAGDWPSRSPP